MADTTQENVLAIAPELSAVSQHAFDLVLSDVADQVKESVFGSKQERAQRYLAAHLLTQIASDEKKGAVASEKTGDVATTYAAGGPDEYDETVYGREFKRIRKGRVVGFMSVRP